MQSNFVKALGAIALLASTSSFDAPRISRIETNNFSNLLVNVSTPYVGAGKTKDYTVYGPWLDHADKATLGGMSLGLGNKTAFLPKPDISSVRVTLSGVGLSPGSHQLVIHINCDYTLGDCAETNFTRTARVLAIGTLTSIQPNTNVPVNSEMEFTITGTQLNVAAINTFKTSLKSPTVLSRDATHMRIHGWTKSCGTDRVVIRDQADGGEYYQYSPGGLDIHLATPCGYVPLPTAPSAPSCPPGQSWDPSARICRSPIEPEDEE